jgi:signal peptidase I
MFDFIFRRKTAKLRKQAKEWLQLARKVDHFRRDVLSEEELTSLRSARAELEAVVKKRDFSVNELSPLVEKLEKVLRRTGGEFYPRSVVTEYVDMIVVAAIVVVGLRTFFLQPFKIPTNSMYPTYNGLTSEVYFEDERPNRLHRAFRTLQLGAGSRALEGEPGDELILPLVSTSSVYGKATHTGRGVLRFESPAIMRGLSLAELPTRTAPGMRFLVVPGPAAFYQFIVGEQIHTLKVPVDFSMEQVVLDIIEKAGSNLRIERNRFGFPAVLHTGIRIPDGGDIAMSFDIKSGDMLFVDRFTYHFRAPKAGEPFVFNTTEIKTMPQRWRGTYYIKRIAGEPGDTLHIEGGDGRKGGQLFRNGELATGAVGFEKNNALEGEYEGYGATPGSYGLTVPVTLGEHEYFALGDNSDDSGDSRSWGKVPEETIVGKAIVIYYPFSHRWGLAK